MSARNSGRIGEEEACKFLKKKGYKILSRNFHSRFGEIDIICQLRDALVFVEVKTRSGDAFGTPIESVTQSKLSRMIATADIFMSQNPSFPKSYSFDVVEVFESSSGYNFSHTKNITL